MYSGGRNNGSFLVCSTTDSGYRLLIRSDITMIRKLRKCAFAACVIFWYSSIFLLVALWQCVPWK